MFRFTRNDILKIKKKLCLLFTVFRSPRLAFTLAEVLITLGIIGIVAEVTIPTLMNNVQDQQFKAAYKKDFSVVAQTVLQMSYDNGGSLAGYFTGDSDVRDKFAKYIIPVKTCNDSFVGGCIDSNIKGLNGATNILTTGPTIVLKDGSAMQFWLGQSDCMQAIGSPVGFYRCAGLLIDVNGLKKPNINGRDIFEMHILNGKVLPYGASGDFSFNMGCSTSTDGTGCSATALYQ